MGPTLRAAELGVQTRPFIDSIQLYARRDDAAFQDAGCSIFFDHRRPSLCYAAKP